MVSGMFFMVKYKKTIDMRSLLYIVAVICLIGWLLGEFVYSATGLIHILIVIAIIAFLIGIIRKGSV